MLCEANAFKIELTNYTNSFYFNNVAVDDENDIDDDCHFNKPFTEDHFLLDYSKCNTKIDKLKGNYIFNNSLHVGFKRHELQIY